MTLCAAAGDNEPDGPVTLLTRVETMLPLAGGAKLGFKHGSHVDFNRQVKNFKGYGDGKSIFQAMDIHTQVKLVASY